MNFNLFELIFIQAIHWYKQLELFELFLVLLLLDMVGGIILTIIECSSTIEHILHGGDCRHIP